MFWADNFTRSEYVGFVDADTLFITYVDREGAWTRLLHTYMAFERCPDLQSSQTCLRMASRWCTAASVWTRPPRGSTPPPAPRHVFSSLCSWSFLPGTRIDVTAAVSVYPCALHAGLFGAAGAHAVRGVVPRRGENGPFEGAAGPRQRRPPQTVRRGLRGPRRQRHVSLAGAPLACTFPPPQPSNTLTHTLCLSFVPPVQRHLRVPVRPAKGQLRLVRPTHPRFR